MPNARNIKWHAGEVSRSDRAAIHGHRGVTLWLTGLSGSGKSTVARELEATLSRRGFFAYVLDGDNVRHGLNRDLAFSPDDRKENIRRIGEVARLFTDAGAITITAFISPYREDRQQVRDLLDTGDFVEVHIAAPLEACEARDTKGLYAKARAGEISDFTGISSPYEAPSDAELTLATHEQSSEESVATVIRFLEDRGYIAPSKGKQ